MRFRSASSFEREAKSRTAHVAARPEGGVEPGQAAATLAAQRSARADSERAGDNRPRSSADRRTEAGAARSRDAGLRSGAGWSSARLRFAKRRLGRCWLAGAAPASSRPQSSPKTSPLGLRSDKEDLGARYSDLIKTFRNCTCDPGWWVCRPMVPAGGRRGATFDLVAASAVV